MARATQWLGAGCFHAVWRLPVLRCPTKRPNSRPSVAPHRAQRSGHGVILENTTSGHGAASQLALFQLTALKGLKDRWNHGVGIWESQLFGAWIVTWLVGTWLWRCPTRWFECLQSPTWNNFAEWHPESALGVQLVASAALPSMWNRFNLDSPCRHPTLAASKTTPNC